MHYPRVLSLSLISLSLLLAGCGSSPMAKIYILNAMERETSVEALTVDGHHIAVKVGPISIPDTLDQPNIVTRTGANSLLADEFNRWSGDFQSDIQGIIGENISILLPTNQVILSQEISLLPIDFQVMVNIRRFDGELGGIVTLNADWTVARKGKDKSVMANKSVLQEMTGGADYQAYVAAQSRLLEKLSQEIADEIKRQLNH
ncbi:MAG: membrane integrity-associated transporter subunit PqiC [Methyloprofundus sp.]|nr:membrane integrity-associated transporter subunit PqiC [Methyloprofundus sp.]